jgi:hypothetical protein
MKRLILKLCLLSALAGVYAHAVATPSTRLDLVCPYCGPEIHLCGPFCYCNCTP